MINHIIYLDNAASTPIHPAVVEEMMTLMATHYGNPSSTHSFGRKSKSIIELARKFIAKTIQVNPNEIFFTSGGTEANNWILRQNVAQGIRRIITQATEHKSILETALELAKYQGIVLEVLPVDEFGNPDKNLLERKLAEINIPTLVSIMQINNETGHELPIIDYAKIAHQYQALFHTDMVQSIGHTSINLTEIDFCTASAHKFHGPKGCGFAYIKAQHNLGSMLNGGNQERGKRAGTENVIAIAGMHKAFKMSMENIYSNQQYLEKIKKYCIQIIQNRLPKAKIIPSQASHILNVGIMGVHPTLLFELDMNGIAVSAGSACTSGSTQQSHVIAALFGNEIFKHYTFLRISFSIYNTIQELNYLVDKIIEITQKNEL